MDVIKKIQAGAIGVDVVLDEQDLKIWAAAEKSAKVEVMGARDYRKKAQRLIGGKPGLSPEDQIARMKKAIAALEEAVKIMESKQAVASA